MRFPKLLLAALLLSLTSCTLVPVAQRRANPGGPEYTVCDDGLEVFPEYRAYQGQNGWFFFEHDLEPEHPLMGQTGFMTELSRPAPKGSNSSSSPSRPAASRPPATSTPATRVRPPSARTRRRPTARSPGGSGPAASGYSTC